MRNEWLYYALIVGINEDVFWRLTPKTIQVYFKAYKKRRETEIQDIWLQGSYFARAITSTIWFGKGKPPEYPKMPFENETIEEMAKDESWIEAQRQRAFLHFKQLLENHK